MAALSNAERQKRFRQRRRNRVTVAGDLPVTVPLRTPAIDPWDPSLCMTQAEREWIEAAQHFLGLVSPGDDRGFRFIVR